MLTVSGVNASLFDTVPSPNPYISAGNLSVAAETQGVDHPIGDLSANASSTYVRKIVKPADKATFPRPCELHLAR